MRFLLDTHVFIWMDIASTKLSAAAQSAIQNPANTLFVSLVSIWEMQIKLQLGKLQLTTPLSTMIQIQQQSNQIQLLPIRLNHILALSHLLHHHRDPFDRLLIAQAQQEQLTLITNDSHIQQYNVTCLW